MQYVQEEDVKFIRLAFCDVFGKQKNISIVADELPRAFEYGIAFDASAITGFGDETRSDLFLWPEPETLTWLPWRPEHGKVVRMFCTIRRPDGSVFECDTRSLLKAAVSDAKAAGLTFFFGAEQEFYLFELDDRNMPTAIPYDHAGTRRQGRKRAARDLSDARADGHPAGEFPPRGRSRPERDRFPLHGGA